MLAVGAHRQVDHRADVVVEQEGPRLRSPGVGKNFWRRPPPAKLTF